MMQLSGPSIEPKSGAADSLVIFLHGVGADGNDLIGLQQYWGRLVPEAEFVSPNAPFPCDMAPYGYQWFSVQDRSPPTVLAGVRAAAPSLDAFIDDELQKRGLDAQLSNFDGATKVHQAIAAGDIDIALASGPDMAFIVKGSPAKSVAAMAGRPNMMALIVASDSPIK